MKTELRKRIAENLRYLRKIFAYTQEEVANMLHLDRMIYVRLETGKDEMNADIIIALSQIYQVRTSVLLETDKKRFLREVTYQRMGGEQSQELTDTFYRLSPFAQGCLVEHASMLLRMEQEKETERGEESEPK